MNNENCLFLMFIYVFIFLISTISRLLHTALFMFSFAQFLVRYLCVNEAQVPSAGQLEEVQIGVILHLH